MDAAHSDAVMAYFQSRCVTQCPADEPVWESLRRVFDMTLDYVEDEHQRARNDAMESIVRSTSHLTARYLEKMQRVQDLLSERVAVRLDGEHPKPGDPRPTAVVGAAFACMLQDARILPLITARHSAITLTRRWQHSVWTA